MSQVLPAGVVFVDDVPRLAAFYCDVAGLYQVDGDQAHAVLEGNGFQLTVHALCGTRPGPDPAGYPTREDTWVKLCFPVADLAAARVRAARLGGELWPPAREWEARGFRACDGRDPEGNVFQLRQRVD